MTKEAIKLSVEIPRGEEGQDTQLLHAGLEIEDGICTKAGPMLGWCIGMSKETIIKYLGQAGWKVTSWIEWIDEFITEHHSE